jgi:beta-glucosidase
MGQALADVLLGVAEPGGRLPTTWPVTLADVPVSEVTPVDGKLHYDEGIHVGHRAWLRAGTEPAYPFGHGLGYTTWSLDDLVVTAPPDPSTGAPATVEVTVTNTGDRAGKQVVQAYLFRPESTVDRPARWLAGHAAIRLEPGRSERVSLAIAARAFAHWADGWRYEPGRFQLAVGTSVTDLPLSASIQLPA